jgi:type VI secretion system protein ImpC
VELLSRVTLLAAHAKTSFVAQGSEDMGEGWGELRSIPEAASLGLALPRFLLRLPYGARTVEIESFPFEELEAKPDPSGYLWGNPALACLTVLTRALYEAEEEEEDAFDLCGLPLHTYEWDGQQMCTPCAEIILTEEQAAALIARGLMPLMCSPDAGRVRLAGLRAAGGQPLLL